MKLWTTVTKVPNDRDHYVVVGLTEEYIADMLRLAAVPLPRLIPETGYSLPAQHTELNLYARSPATDAVLGPLFRNEGEDEDLDVVLDVEHYSDRSVAVGYETFETLHNALTLAGSKANPDWGYESYVNRIELTTHGIVTAPVNIQVTEEGAERVAYVVIDINPEQHP